MSMGTGTVSIGLGVCGREESLLCDANAVWTTTTDNTVTTGSHTIHFDAASAWTSMISPGAEIARLRAALDDMTTQRDMLQYEMEGALKALEYERGKREQTGELTMRLSKRGYVTMRKEEAERLISAENNYAGALRSLAEHQKLLKKHKRRNGLPDLMDDAVWRRVMRYG